MVASGTPIFPENPALARRHGRSIARAGLAPFEPPRRPVRQNFVDHDEAEGLQHHRRHLGGDVVGRKRKGAGGVDPLENGLRRRSGVARVPPFQRDDIGAFFDHCKNPRPRRRIMRTCGFVAPGRNIVRGGGAFAHGNRCRGQCRPNTKKAEPCPAFDRPVATTSSQTVCLIAMPLSTKSCCNSPAWNISRVMSQPPTNSPFT